MPTSEERRLFNEFYKQDHEHTTRGEKVSSGLKLCVDTTKVKDLVKEAMNLVEKDQTFTIATALTLLIDAKSGSADNKIYDIKNPPRPTGHKPRFVYSKECEE